MKRIWGKISTFDKKTWIFLGKRTGWSNRVFNSALRIKRFFFGWGGTPSGVYSITMNFSEEMKAYRL